MNVATLKSAVMVHESKCFLSKLSNSALAKFD